MMKRYLTHGLLWCCLPLTACQIQPVNEPVPVDVPAHWDQTVENTAMWPAPDWWRNFGSAELDRLMDEARNNNLDLAAALDAVLLLRAEIPDDAFTASILGTERAGSGVAIGEDGLVLTIGYLVTETASIWLTTNRGTVVQGHALAYDQATGFGLVAPLGRLGVQPLARGSARAAAPGDPDLRGDVLARIAAVTRFIKRRSAASVKARSCARSSGSTPSSTIWARQVAHTQPAPI